MFKVIIAGGRYFKDYKILEYACDKILKNKTEIEIISGAQVTVDELGNIYGADYFGECYAIKRKYLLKKFPADWNLHGRFAGPIRNAEMAEYADALIAFWDGKSKGTKNMIDTAKFKNLPVRVIKY